MGGKGFFAFLPFPEVVVRVMVPSYGVLVAEDDPCMVRLYRGFLASCPGFVLLGTVDRGEDLLRWFREGRGGDLLLLDLYLVGTHGLDVLMELRRLRVEVDTLVVSSENRPEAVREAFRLGAFDYLVKPFGAERLKQSLRAFRDFRGRLDGFEGGLLQEQVDALRERAPSPVEEGLPKGLHPATLRSVLAFLARAASLSSEEVGAELGLSRTTARRYLEYLASQGMADLVLDHRGRGRPLHRYCLSASSD